MGGNRETQPVLLDLLEKWEYLCTWRETEMGWWEDLLKRIPGIRAALLGKVQVTENGDVYFGGEHTHYHGEVIKVGMSPDEVKKMIAEYHEEEEGKLIDQKTKEQLEAQKDEIQKLPEPEQIDAVVKATTQSIRWKLLGGQVTISGDTEAKLTVRPPPSTDLPDKGNE